MTKDNLHLQLLRKRLGRTQRDVSNELGGISISAISDFENGHRDDLPGGYTSADYEALLNRWADERES